MSRWLRNVNALLENLDGRVEETVEERLYNNNNNDDDDDAEYYVNDGNGENNNVETLTDRQGVDDILAKRGLLVDDDEEDDDDVGVATVDAGGGDIMDASMGNGGADRGAMMGGDLGGGTAGDDDNGGAEQQQQQQRQRQRQQHDGNVDEADGDGENDQQEEIINFDNEGEGQQTERGGDLFDTNSSLEQTTTDNEHKSNGSRGDATNDKNEASAQSAEESASDQNNSPANATESNEKVVNASAINTKPKAQPIKSPPPSSATSSSIPPSSLNTKAAAPTSTNTSNNPTNNQTNNSNSSSNNNNNTINNNANLKELRKLRRHVLQLNSDLESAEREIEAQRNELERAALRMERDRSRHKQEKESSEASHKAELAALSLSQEKSWKEWKERNDQSLAEMEGRVKRAELQRVQEGGERDADLQEALERERGAISRVTTLQEERATMKDRIDALAAEISRLETRLEHATSQMELASERERNAEEQLDKALSLHARQLGVRQGRESELEQMVADLGAALVVAKGKVEAAMKGGIMGSGREMGGNDAGTTMEEDAVDLKDRLQDAQDEVETLRAQLFLERQRCSTLHSELQELSKEQADELSGAHARQRQYERKISDLSTLVAKLQSSIRRKSSVDNDDGDGEDAESNSDEGTNSTALDLQYSGDEKKETDHLRKQINSLSEKVIEQESKINHGRSEISTLKNRLRSALLRAETAEKALEAANQRLIMMDMPGEGGYAMSGMSSADEEMGLSPSRRRKGRPMGSSAGRRGFPKSSKVESIRSALGLHPGRIPTGGCQELVAQLLDTFDNLAVDLGSHFRHYPVSRLAFMVYLAILHLWAFFLLVYHAHAQGTGGSDHYGPESLLRSYRHLEQVPKMKVP